MDTEQKQIKCKQTTNPQQPTKCKEYRCKPHYRIRDRLPTEKGYPYNPVVVEYYCEEHGLIRQY